MTSKHVWEMTNIQFGFMVFEKCFHCNGLRTYFSDEDHPILGDRYRQGDCHWTRMENAQSFVFDLQCTKTGHVEKFDIWCKPIFAKKAVFNLSDMLVNFMGLPWLIEIDKESSTVSSGSHDNASLIE